MYKIIYDKITKRIIAYSENVDEIIDIGYDKTRFDEAFIDSFPSVKGVSYYKYEGQKAVPYINNKTSYELKIEQLIREKYSISDELAILRLKDTKPEEFQEYFNYAEECKKTAKLMEESNG